MTLKKNNVIIFTSSNTLTVAILWLKTLRTLRTSIIKNIISEEHTFKFMRHDGQGGQYREQNVIIFTLWDWRLFSLVQAWEYSYGNNTVKIDIPNLNKQEN